MPASQIVLLMSGMITTHWEAPGFVTGSGVWQMAWTAVFQGPTKLPVLGVIVAHAGQFAGLVLVEVVAQYSGVDPEPFSITHSQLLAPLLVPQTCLLCKSSAPVLP